MAIRAQQENVKIQLHGLLGSGHWRKLRTPPRLVPSATHFFGSPRGALEWVVSFMNGEQERPIAWKVRAISQGFTYFPRSNRDITQELVSFTSTLTPVKGCVLHLPKRLQADSSATQPDKICIHVINSKSLS